MTSSLQLRARAILRNMKTLKKKTSLFRPPPRLRFSPLPSVGMIAQR